MGFKAEKVILSGLFGGLNHAKNGKTYLSVLSPGPIVDKVQVEDGKVNLPDSVVFGTPVNVLLSNAEQKFKDFNGSFSSAQSVQLQISK